MRVLAIPRRAAKSSKCRPAAEINRIEPKIQQLEAYESRLPEIEDGLRQRANAAIVNDLPSNPHNASRNDTTMAQPGATAWWLRSGAPARSAKWLSGSGGPRPIYLPLATSSSSDRSRRRMLVSWNTESPSIRDPHLESERVAINGDLSFENGGWLGSAIPATFIRSEVRGDLPPHWPRCVAIAAAARWSADQAAEHRVSRLVVATRNQNPSRGTRGMVLYELRGRCRWWSWSVIFQRLRAVLPSRFRG